MGQAERCAPGLIKGDNYAMELWQGYIVRTYWGETRKFRLSAGNHVVRLSLFAIALGFGSVVIYRTTLSLYRTGRPFLTPLHAEDWLALAVTLSFIFNSLTTKS